MTPQLTEKAVTLTGILTALNNRGLTNHHSIALLQCCGSEWRTGISMGRLAKATGTSPAAVTGLVDTMERRGLLKRSHSREDRRKIHVMATGKGAELFRSVLAEISPELNQTSA